MDWAKHYREVRARITNAPKKLGEPKPIPIFRVKSTRRNDPAAIFRGPDYFRKIVRTVCEKYEVDAADVLGRSRLKKIVFARFEVAYLLHRRGLSSVQIGRLMDRDHTTIIYAIGAYEHAIYKIGEGPRPRKGRKVRGVPRSGDAAGRGSDGVRGEPELESAGFIHEDQPDYGRYEDGSDLERGPEGA